MGQVSLSGIYKIEISASSEWIPGVRSPKILPLRLVIFWSKELDQKCAFICNEWVSWFSRLRLWRWILSGFLRLVDFLLVCTVRKSRRQPSLRSPPWEPEISFSNPLWEAAISYFRRFETHRPDAGSRKHLWSVAILLDYMTRQPSSL
jgi:hypothetical protein